jgi:flagellar motor switch protein FliM
MAGSVPKFLAQIGQFHGRRALKVQKKVEPSDRVE